MAGALQSHSETATSLERSLWVILCASFTLLLLFFTEDGLWGLGLLLFAPAFGTAYLATFIVRYRHERELRAASHLPPPALHLATVCALWGLLTLYVPAAALCVFTTVISLDRILRINCRIAPPPHPGDIICDGLGAFVVVVLQNVLTLTAVVVLASLLWRLRGGARGNSVELPADFEEADLERGYRPCDACGQVVYVPMAPPIHRDAEVRACALPRSNRRINACCQETATVPFDSLVDVPRPPPYTQN